MLHQHTEMFYTYAYGAPLLVLLSTFVHRNFLFGGVIFCSSIEKTKRRCVYFDTPSSSQ